MMPFQDLEPLAILLIVVIALVILKVLLNGRRPKIRYPYEKIDALFTNSEKKFLRVLQDSTPRGYVLYGKVRIADLMRVRKGESPSEWQRAFNRIKSKHVDYVLCRADDFRVCAAIELDDKSHEREDRQRRDAFVEKAFAAAKIPLLRFPVQPKYSEKVVRQALREVVRKC